MELAVDGMIKEAMTKDLSFTPGTKFSYTNLGYTLLGLAIEHQSKKERL
jgi:CubicO group peptidase (beta-lactamase class C family)